MTPTALYRHFKDKDALTPAVVRAVYGIFRQALVVELPRTGNAEVGLRIGFDRFLRFALEHPNYYRLLFLEPRNFAIDKYPADFQQGKSAGFRRLSNFVADGMRSGMLRGKPSTDSADVALTVYAHMHGLIALYLAGRFPDVRNFERFYRESLERLLDGLRA